MCIRDRAYVTRLELSAGLESLTVTTEALPPFSRTREISLSRLELGKADGSTDEKLSFKAKGDSTWLLLDRPQAAEGGADLRTLQLTLSGKATPRAMKQALKTIRRGSTKSA
eukprot:TRINITY_DN10882_c0_g1_i2.p2 TRINITY_DN10882_c0_g1~~TRINITY_DN10882_c0_g1_i2.p2  ORF type:complete len:112 (-),score=31.01 TRINITY_DN10882_c0_g1_i2:221-556(-)